MRTLDNLRDLMTEFMVLDLDNSKGESPTDGNKDEQLNWAYREISRRLILFDPSITFTLVADQAVYDLRDTTTPVVSKKVVRPYGVYINNSPLFEADHRKRGLWKFPELEDQAPGWRATPSGTPYIACQTNITQLLLYPKPTAGIVSGGHNYIAGTYIPADMTLDADVPDIPEELHECIAYLGAIRASLPTATEDEMWKRIQEFNGSWVSLVDRVAQEQNNLLQVWGARGVNAYPDYLFA